MCSVPVSSLMWGISQGELEIRKAAMNGLREVSGV